MQRAHRGIVSLFLLTLCTLALSTSVPDQNRAKDLLRAALRLQDSGASDEEVMAKFREALALYPDFAEGLINYGSVLNNAKRHEEALEVYKRALAVPHSPNASWLAALHHNMASAYFAVGDTNAAVRAHLSCVNAMPHKERTVDGNWPTYFNSMAFTLQRLGEHQSVVDLYAQAGHTLKDHALTHNTVGISLWHLGRKAEAGVHYFHAATMDESNPDAHFNYGMYLEDQGNLDGASKAYFNSIFTQKGDIKPAVLAFEKVMQDARLFTSPMAEKVFAKAVDEGVYLSRYHRPQQYTPGLTSQPWWDPADFPWTREFEDNWEVIRDEMLATVDDDQMEVQEWLYKGKMAQFQLWMNGYKNEDNCKLAPRTCELVSKVLDATSCIKGNVKFAIMYPGTHLQPHCGPSNIRVRLHLGLKVPAGDVHIRVANTTRNWVEGKWFAFDDSFEHEVIHNGDGMRGVLIMDVWHPDSTDTQRLEYAGSKRAASVYTAVRNGVQPTYSGIFAEWVQQFDADEPYVPSVDNGGVSIDSPSVDHDEL